MTRAKPQTIRIELVTRESGGVDRPLTAADLATAKVSDGRKGKAKF